MELAILELISKLKNPVLDAVMVFVSTLGTGGIIYIVLGAYLASTKKYRKMGFTILFALLLCLIFGNLMLKPLINRERPYESLAMEILVPPLQDGSFPSGHTFSAFATAFSVNYYNKRFAKWLFGFAIVMAFSRMYLYVHYPTDILGGIVLGYLCAKYSRKFIKKYVKTSNVKKA